MHADEIRTHALSERIIGCAFRVLNTLGAGFLEKIYENALAHELREAGTDLVVAGTVVVELKASKSVDPTHTAQCINYLKATGLHLCLLPDSSKPRLEDIV